MSLFLDSEKVAPTGNVTSSGIINQLGRPSLDLLAVLVREVVQNSWDARSSAFGPVYFGMDGWTLNTDQHRILREGVFGKTPPNEHLSLAEILSSQKPINVLAISDRGTNGLGGPTRADIITRSDDPRDFVDFFRNVGQPPDKQLAGGTYGYGKAALYRASRAKTICVYTRCETRNGLETRFMASALGEPYSTSKDRYTGRHWWGRRDDCIAEPLLNSQADAVAQRLGLPTFTGSGCGTTIMIVDPNLGEEDDDKTSSLRTPQQAFNLMAEHILWYFWPKMLTYGHEYPAIAFELSWHGKKVHLPIPEDFSPLQGYVQAMYRLKDYKVDSDNPFRFIVEDIASQRPKQHLGKLAIQQFPTSSVNYFDTGNSESPFAGMTHHTAVMRQPELIVKYLPGAIMPNEKLGYAGIFITDSEVDPVFAEAEPPTHDDWVSQSLENRRHRTFVNVALREIGKRMDTFAKPPAARTNSRGLTPLGAFATRLGSSLIPAEQGPAATSKPFSVHPTSPQRKGHNSQSPKPPPPHFVATRSDIDIAMPSRNDVDDSQFGSRVNGNLPAIKPMIPDIPDYSDSDSTPGSSLPESESDSASPQQSYVYEPPKYNPPPATSNHKSRPITGRARVKHIDDSYVLVDDIPALQFEFSVSHAGNSSGATVRVSARAVLDGNQLESEPPIGGSAAQVLHWIDPCGMIYASSDEIFIGLEPTGNWYVIISLPDDMMVGVEFKAEARAAE
jgi:hypothetical protein